MRSMSPRVVTLLPYTPAAHLLYHHCCCCNCFSDAATYACPVYYTCSCAAAVTSRPNISLYWNHLPPYPVSGISLSDPPNSRLSRRSYTEYFLIYISVSCALYGPFLSKDFLSKSPGFCFAQFFVFPYFPLFFCPNIGMRSLPNILPSVKERKIWKKVAR